ncbi:MAG: MbcA/ParS/Xre antitoxin family protein [Bryobacteraceae bacterium]|jgi:hypothetical protein
MSEQQATQPQMESPEKLASELRAEISSQLPNGAEWLKTPHQMLGGETPEERISAGDLDSVRHLLHSILYIGVI